MSIASRYGKLRIADEDDDTRCHRIEDLLTADVFGAYRYLPTHLGVRPLLAHAVSADGQSLEHWASERGIAWNELTTASYAFWPSLADKEPDLAIALGSGNEAAALCVLVEVKLHSEQHEIDGRSQLGFYGAAMLEDRFDPAPFDITLPDFRPIVFMTAATEIPRGALARARNELGDYLSERRTEVFWVGWPTAARLARQALAGRKQENAPRHELALLEDLVEDLEQRGFGPPRPRKEFPLPPLEPLPPLQWSKGPGPKRRCIGDVLNIPLQRIDEDLRRWRTA